MKKVKIYEKKIFLLISLFIPIISLFIGFILNEDLSTGGSSWDFNLTWPVIENYANFNFFGSAEFTRHVPLHYIFLSFIYNLTNDQYLVRIFYLFFSLLLPTFLYLNLIKIYNYNKLGIFLFSFSLLFLPLFRATAIWPNAHLTAVIFFVISNFFFLKSINKQSSYFHYLNLFFLALATYSMQTYVLLFAYYLINYFYSEKISNFIKLFLFCCLLGLPGLYFIGLNERIAHITIAPNLFNNITTNFSIIFLYFIFLIFNKQNVLLIANKLINIKKLDFFFLILISIFIVYNLDQSILSGKQRGGGFFYKVSHFFFKNNIIFIISFFFGLLVSYLLVKENHKILYVIILMNLLALNFHIYQKYFEPLFLIMIMILFKSSLVKNILLNIKNILFFYVILICYFLTSYVNQIYKFSFL